MKTILMATVVSAVLGVFAWVMFHESVLPPEFDRGIESVSYNITAPGENEADGEAAEELLRQVDRDMALIAGVARSIRLYASVGLFHDIPPIARRHGLGVVAGAWVSADEKATRAELDALIDVANRNPNVRSVVVGNETILREEVEVEELIALLRQTRQRVRVPVTTGETWDIWLKHPELGREVDYIAAHILPYWEGIPADMTVAYAFERYAQLREAFPGKKIVIAEFGWPSRGTNNRAADPGPMIQASVVRGFLEEAQRRGVPYNIIEAIDQPWKTAEGAVGPYWGLYDAGRTAKFAFEGRVEERTYWLRAAIGVALGAVFTLLSFAAVRRRTPTFVQVAAVGLAAQALGTGVAMAVLYPFENYLNVGSAIAWSVGILLMIPLTVMTLVKVAEVADIVLGRRPRRLIRAPAQAGANWRAPKVSVQIAACRENPAMLIETLDSVAALDYPDFEVLVIVNNTPDETQWRPIEAHCAKLGERFKFINLPQVDGFKAGALDTAMSRVAPDAEILALIDADYIVHRDWLKDLVPAFADPAVGLVQAPQDHRDGEASTFKTVMNSEYAGFFDIGMVQRNEDDAIIAHGTMLLLRRSAFEAVGGWDSATITEDTELGLRLFRGGWSALYTNRRYGWGCLPDTFSAFRKQRHRWAYGAVQIIRRHWRAMLPRDRSLTQAQKYQFVTGWSFWMSDTVGVGAAILNLLWVPMILVVGVMIPMLPFTLPILAMFVVNLAHCALLYGVRVRQPAYRIAGAALAAMSLQFTVAKAVAKSVANRTLPFLRTDKGGQAVRGPRGLIAVPEAFIGSALASGAALLYFTNTVEMMEVDVFAATLMVQSLPFLAAPAMLLLERLSDRGAAVPAPQQPTPVSTSPGI